MSERKRLTDKEGMVLMYAASGLVDPVPCTECRYCTTHCPLGLDIPMLLSLYNEHNANENDFISTMTIESLAENKRPSACINCKSCEDVCPQRIRISEFLADLAEAIE